MRSRHDPRRSFRPLLEALEARTLLSVCTVDRLTDVGEGEKMAGDLRYCIEQAQDGDSIQFAVKDTINLESALPNLTTNVRIEGPGPNALTIRRARPGNYFLLTVDSGVTALLSGLTFAGGSIEGGGGILNLGNLTVSHCILSGHATHNTVGSALTNWLGTLTLSNTTVSGNSPAGAVFDESGRVTITDSTFSQNLGGGFANNAGTLVIRNSTFAGNTLGAALILYGQATITGSRFVDNAGEGIVQIGGVLSLNDSTLTGNRDAALVAAGDEVTVTNSTFSRNSGGAVLGSYSLTIRQSIFADNDGSAISFYGSTLTLSDSVLTGNRAGHGGGLYLDRGLAVVQSCVFTENRAGGFGGGIAVMADGVLVVNESTLVGNVAASGGGIANPSGRITVQRSTLVGNRADGWGGGILNGSASTITNSTLSGNVAAAGGGVALAGTIEHSTITGNRAIGSAKGKGTGGGVLGSNSFRMRNTIVAGNLAASGPDLDGELVVSGHNLIGNSQGGSGYARTDLLNVDPLLGPLQDNGGPTQTHALLPGSPAIDAGGNADAPKFDQRALPRVTGNVIDLGAFEVQPGPVAAFSLYAPESALAGMPFDLYLVAYDADGYVATTYTGTVAFFSSTDPDAVLPKPYTFIEADAGVVYLPESAVLYAEGLQDVWAYDVDTFAFGLAYVEVFPGSAPGGAPNLPWTYWPDAAALLALLSQQPRVRP